MPKRLARLVADFWIVLAFAAAALVALPSHAGLIGTDAAQAQDERARVDAMSDAEVLQLAGRLDAAAAGGQISNETLLLFILILLLLIILL